MKLATVILALSCVAGATSATATTITFDDFNNDNVIPLPDTYAGLNWNNFYVIPGPDYINPASDYGDGVVSPKNVAFNGSGRPATISSGSPFTLNSGYFTAPFMDDLTVEVTGFDGATQLYTTSFVVDTSGPMLVTFDWTGLSKVTFATSGGTVHPGFGGSFPSFSLDNLTVDEPVASVPEPATWALAIAGFGLAGGALRRRAARLKLVFA